MENKKQTSVDWLHKSMLSHLSHEQQMQFEGLFQQAKEMEGEHTMDVYKKGYIDGECNATDITIIQRNL